MPLRLRFSRFSITQGAEGRDASLDPVLIVAELYLRVRLADERGAEARGLVRGHLKPEHEVGGVAGGGEHALARGGAVDGAVVVLVLGELGGDRCVTRSEVASRRSSVFGIGLRRGCRSRSFKSR